MPLTAPVKKFESTPIEAGSYAARIYSIIDLGTHDSTYQGKPTDPKRSIRITWELPTEMRDFEKDGEKKSLPQVIGKEYTLSMGEKANLRKAVECIVGTSLSDDEATDFDVFSLVGMESLLSIVHETSKATGNKYAAIQSIGKLPKGMTCPAPVNPQATFNVQEWNQSVYESLPEFIKKKIDECHEKIGKKVDSTVFFDEETGQEVPF